MLCDFDVEVNGFKEFFFGDFLEGGVGYVDGAGAEEERLSPVGEGGDVSGEFGDHGGQAFNGAHADEGSVEGEVDCGEVTGDCDEGGADGSRGSDGADEDLGFSLVGDDVGGVAAVNLADVEGAGADAFQFGQGHGEDTVEDFNELVNGAFAELGIGGVGHLAGAFEGGAEGAFGGEGEAIVSRFAVDEEAAAFGGEIGDLGAGGVALFAGDEEEADGQARGAEGLSGGYLGGDDALGIADAAAVEELGVFAKGDVGGDGVHVGGEDKVWGLARDAGVDVPAGAGVGGFMRLLDGSFFNGPAAVGEEGGEEIADCAFVVGGGLDFAELAGEADWIDGIEMIAHDIGRIPYGWIAGWGWSGRRRDWSMFHAPKRALPASREKVRLDGNWA